MTEVRRGPLQLSNEPQFLDNLRSLRVEIDALLVFLPSNSKTEKDEDEAKEHKSQQLQRGLFDHDAARAALPPTQKAELATLVEALLLEITAALATGEIGDEQDHR